MEDISKNTVLIVDDVAENIDILKSLLGPHYAVKAAINGNIALKIAGQVPPPDLVLLDIMMPGIDGFEVCSQLQNNPNTSAIPIIFLTAKTDVDTITRAFAEGAADYISKPFNPSELLARVKTQLQLKVAMNTLLQQNEELKETARLREDIERITRHDLKAPLNGIIGYPQLLKDDDNLDARQVKYLNIIEKLGYTMLDMINLSLDLFKMEQGMYEYSPTCVDVVSVIKRVCDESRQIIDKKELVVEWVFASEQSDHATFNVFGEDLLLYSMFANLMKNAFEASPQGQAIEVMLKHEQDVAVISIKNQGAVPENMTDVFFEKYTTTKKSGTGLGAYSAKLIAKTHGGTIGLHASQASDTTTIAVKLTTHK